MEQVADIKDVQILLELGKQYNLEYLSAGDISITFRENKPDPTVNAIDRRMLAEAIGESEGRPTEDEFLFMSTPLGPDSIHTEPLKEEEDGEGL